MRYLTYLTLLLALTSLTGGLLLAQEWHVETIDTLSFDVWWKTSIALDSNNYPHIVYGNINTPGLRYAHWTGSEWDIEFIESTGSVAGSSIVIDSQDKPRICYAVDGILKYAVWNGSDWVIETVGPEYASVPSLVLDAQDEPHIAFDYCEADSDCDLRYAYKSEGQWNIDIVDPEYGSGWWVSLALDGNEYPHISYFWNIYGSKGYTDLRYAHWTGSDWQTETVTDSSYGAYINSIAVDSQNYPHISYYYQEPETDEIRYAHWTGSSWDIQALDSGFYVGASNSIALDNQDNPCIAYQAYFEKSDNFLRYAHWTGSEWNIQDVDYGAGIGKACSLALDSHDYPYISYIDTANNTLKIAWYGYGLGISLLSFTATPQEDSVALDWQVECTEGEQIAGFNLYRREINYNNDIAAEVSNLGCIWTRVNPTLITGQNPYTYTDAQVVLGKSYEYRLEAVLADESTETLGTASCAPTPPAFVITKIYPNPASDVLNIALTLPQVGKVTLELYDLTGRVVVSKNIQAVSPGEFSEQLDVSGLANGVYTLRATQASLSASERVVVVR